MKNLLGLKGQFEQLKESVNLKIKLLKFSRLRNRKKVEEKLIELKRPMEHNQKDQYIYIMEVPEKEERERGREYLKKWLKTSSI